MSKNRRITVLVLITIFTVAILSIPAHACSSASAEINPEVLIKNAEIIVRATATGYAGRPADSSQIRSIEFRVEEILKGENVPNTFLIGGFLTGEDDFNDGPIPYNGVRPMGRHGSCYARHYKQGAEFLLFLKRHNPSDERSMLWGEITPYWASMAATNEQLSSSADAWLLWVREYLRRSNEQSNANLLLPHDTPNLAMQPTGMSESFIENLALARLCPGG